jgi:Cu+-exporting ATPase
MSNLDCFHCSLEIQGKPVKKTFNGTELLFCCLGCSIAYELLNTNAENNEEKLEKLIKANSAIKTKSINQTLALTDTKTYQVKGITCASCTPIIEKIISLQEGVLISKVNPISEKIKISYDNNYFNLPLLEKELKRFGYTLIKKNKEEELEYLSQLYLLRLGMVWFITMNLMALSFAFYYGELEKSKDVLWSIIYIEFILCSITIFVLGFPFLKNAFFKLLKFQFSMETLVSFGTLTAYSYSVYRMLHGNIDVYYDTSSMIIAFVLLGKFLENASKSKASQTIKKLFELQAKTATILENQEEKTISVEELKVEDLVVVKAGEKIPADGIIIEGDSYIDESMLTGESLAVEKKVESKVYSATINQEGRFLFKVTAVGDDTALSKIIELVEQAQEEKTETQKLADRISAWFIPVVLLIALGTGLFWFLSGAALNIVLLNAISVLVVACPCALGLATPMATFVAIDKAAEMGIILKNSSLLEELNTIDTIVFDKTGTLTESKMTVKEIQILDNLVEETTLFELIASIESYAEHTIAKAITNHFKEKNTSFKAVENFKISKGLGVEGTVDNFYIRIGNLSFLEKESEIPALTKNNEVINVTTVFISVNNTLVAYIALENKIKEQAKETINKLKAKNFNIFMLTGDNHDSASHVAKELGIANYFYNQLPEAKIKVITELQKEGKKVMMVGDGINDAPALVQADIGLAIANATDISMEASDIAIINRDLDVIPKVFDLGEVTLKYLKINILWAFSYNIIGIPMAMLGLLKPIVAAALMSLSSLFIISNSLRLRRKL